jgi:hypothetical protein
MQMPPFSSKSSTRSALACVFLAAGVAVGACGSLRSPTMLDTEKVERAIERSGWEQRRIRVQVTCPAGVRQSQGLVFSCTAMTPGRSTRFVVTQLDGSGRVRYEGL